VHEATPVKSPNPWLRFPDRLGRFLFPPACLACDEGRALFRAGGVCPACWDALPPAAGTRCAICDLPIAAPGAAALPRPVCGRCLAEPPSYDTLRCPVVYADAARSVLKAYKYGGADYLAPRLAERMAEVLPGHAPDALFVPVPATARERRERGFFPAGNLASELARRSGGSFSRRLLVKTRETERQASLPLARRADNVRGAFRCRSAPSSVVLVDDVATSGATLSSCARALKGRGAQRVDAVAFARALPEAP
jgi:predicted amidophosphoribosyltransferase